MQKAIICDIDGTLANVEHRRHFVEDKKNADWDAFNAEMGKDTINEWCKELLKIFYANGYEVLLVSGRPFEYTYETIFWLDKNEVQYSELFLREKKNDHRKDTIVKTEIYNNKIKGNYDILFVVDDRASVVANWRDLGLICLQCDKGNF